MKLSIGSLAILGVAVVTAAVIGVMSGIILRAHQRALIGQLTRSADQLSETVAGGIYYDMLENRRDDTHREIKLMGREQGIDRIRVFNKTGEITFSSDSSEIGHALDKKAEACYACHAAGRPLERLSIGSRARIFRGADGLRVLGMIRPIHNEPRCVSAGCHAHTADETVLGVLDVNLSMASADRQIAHDRIQLMLLAVLAIAASSTLLWWLSRYLILRPVAALIAGTSRVAQGDLSTSIHLKAQNELGDLARAFNDMTVRLNEAQRLLTQSDKLASVGRLAAGVAHEINNPLTGVLTYASFLLKRAEAGSESGADLEVIVRETKRCREIVRGLLDFARQTPPKRQPTDLNDVVRRAATIVTNQLTLARVRLDFRLAEDLRPVPADANQIQQVVVNLLLNAADAIEGKENGGGTITVRTSVIAVPPRGHAVIRAASCPKGCDLIDKNVRLEGVPTIRVLRHSQDQDVDFHLDPVYGRTRHQASAPSEQGDVATHSCPRCRTKLQLPDSRCPTCGAPLFAVQVPGLGAVEWCSSKGCAFTRWEAMDARGPQAYAQIEVEDTGCGISAEEMSRVFEPFYSTKGTRGTGLGLAVTWGIVEGHGGSIYVSSEVGRGTRFTLRLPFLVGDSGPAEAPVDPVSGRRLSMPDARGAHGAGPASPVASRANGSSATSPPAAPPARDRGGAA